MRGLKLTFVFQGHISNRVIIRTPTPLIRWEVELVQTWVSKLHWGNNICSKRLATGITTSSNHLRNHTVNHMLNSMVRNNSLRVNNNLQTSKNQPVSNSGTKSNIAISEVNPRKMGPAIRKPYSKMGSITTILDILHSDKIYRLICGLPQPGTISLFN